MRCVCLCADRRRSERRQSCSLYGSKTTMRRKRWRKTRWRQNPCCFWWTQKKIKRREKKYSHLTRNIYFLRQNTFSSLYIYIFFFRCCSSPTSSLPFVFLLFRLFFFLFYHGLSLFLLLYFLRTHTLKRNIAMY